MACTGRTSTVSLAQQFLIYLHIPLPKKSLFLMMPKDVFHPVHKLHQPTNIYRWCMH